MTNRLSHGVQAHPGATKAFKVSHNWGDAGMTIVWARNYFEAKRAGASDLDLEYGEVECERYPKLDGFPDGGDLLGFLIDDGWWFQCSQCEAHCSDGSLLRAGDAVFCNEECRAKYEAYWAPKRALEAAFRSFAQVKFFGMPRVRFAYVNVGGEALLYDYDASGRVGRLLTISRSELGL